MVSYFLMVYCLSIAVVLAARLLKRNMGLRPGRHLVSPLQAPQASHSSDDRISSLPEDLLLQVLVRLKSARTAACAGAVSRSWHGLWMHLPELIFNGVEPNMLEDVLAKVTCPRLDLLDITVTIEQGTQVASLLRAATQLVPEKLIFCVWWCDSLDDGPIELPCFNRTCSLALQVTGLHLIPPRSGEFTALKSLSLSDCRGIDIRALLLLCPSLRVLNMYNLVEVDTMIIHSASLEELNLETKNTDFTRIDIAAPVLKELTLMVWLDKYFSLSFSAPMVTTFKWVCVCDLLKVGLNGLWQLDTIREGKQHDFHVVSLDIDIEPALDYSEGVWSFAQMIAQLPVTSFSAMEVGVRTEGHSFGPLALHLLRIRPIIQRFKLVLARGKGGVSCPANCPCEQSSNWRVENISLPNLEAVDIHGLQGEDDEVDFLKLVLRSAPVLRTLTMRIPDDVSPSEDGHQKMYEIMKEYPDVEYHVHSSGSESVSYP